MSPDLLDGYDCDRVCNTVELSDLLGGETLQEFGLPDKASKPQALKAIKRQEKPEL